MRGLRGHRESAGLLPGTHWQSSAGRSGHETVRDDRFLWFEVFELGAEELGHLAELAPLSFDLVQLGVLFTRELARRWGPLGVSAAAAHPGMVRSQWGRTGPAAVRLVMNSPFRLAMRSPERGADTLVWLATSAQGRDWESGGYFADRKPATAGPAADDADLAKELWERSAQMCGMDNAGRF